MEDDKAFEYFGYWNAAAAVKTLRIFHFMVEDYEMFLGSVNNIKWSRKVNEQGQNCPIPDIYI